MSEPNQRAFPLSLYRTKSENMRPRKYAGSDVLVAEVFQHMPPEAVEQLRASFEILLNDRRADWPSSWCQCRAVSLVADEGET